MIREYDVNAGFLTFRWKVLIYESKETSNNLKSRLFKNLKKLL